MATIKVEDCKVEKNQMKESSSHLYKKIKSDSSSRGNFQSLLYVKQIIN